MEDWLGNELAEFLAGHAAKANGPPSQAISDRNFFHGRATLILKRAMAVHKIFLGEVGATMEPRGEWIVRERPVHQAIRLSGRSLRKDARGAFHCLGCAGGQQQAAQGVAGCGAVIVHCRRSPLKDCPPRSASLTSGFATA